MKKLCRSTHVCQSYRKIMSGLILLRHSPMLYMLDDLPDAESKASNHWQTLSWISTMSQHRPTMAYSSRLRYIITSFDSVWCCTRQHVICYSARCRSTEEEGCVYDKEKEAACHTTRYGACTRLSVVWLLFICVFWFAAMFLWFTATCDKITIRVVNG